MYTWAEQGDVIPPKTSAYVYRDYDFNTTISKNSQITIQYNATNLVYATVPELKATERKLQTNIDNHIRDAPRHVSDQERIRWNGKADATHRHRVSDIDGLETIIGNQTTNKANQADLTGHIQNRNNPHNVTKQQVGLGNVANVEQASKIDFQNHLNNRNNPHSVTKHQVGLGNVDNVRQASYESVEALKREFQEHEDRLNAIEYMFLQNDFTAPIRTDDGTEHTLLADENGHVIVADWKYIMEV
jgi:tail fiber protein